MYGVPDWVQALAVVCALLADAVALSFGIVFLGGEFVEAYRAHIRGKLSRGDL